MTRLFILVPFLLFASLNTIGQDNELNPDRPDQTEEVHLAPKGKIILESGFIINSFDSGRNAHISRTMIRYGLVKRVEIGLLSEQGRDRNRYMEETVQSTYPFAARVKVALVEKHKWLPDITLVSYLQLPLAKNDEGERAHTSVCVLLAFLNELSDKWKLEYNGGFQQEAFSSKIGWQVYTSLHYQFAEKLESFVGSYSQFQKEAKPFHNADIGLGYKIKKNLQLDVAAGTSIDHPDHNEFVTFGFAVML